AEPGAVASFRSAPLRHSHPDDSAEEDGRGPQKIQNEANSQSTQVEGEKGISCNGRARNGPNRSQSQFSEEVDSLGLTRARCSNLHLVDRTLGVRGSCVYARQARPSLQGARNAPIHLDKITGALHAPYEPDGA